MRRLRLLVVDDHPVVHQGVRLLLEHATDIEIVGEAVCGTDAIEAVQRTTPNVVLLDVRLPDMLVEEVVHRIRAVSPSSKIVIFTAHVSPTVTDEATRLAVHGFLGKDASPEHFLEVITRVAAGEVLTDRVSADALRQAGDKLHATPLTPREHEILRRAAIGESNAEIAQAIYLSPTTVKSYLQTALQKLDAHNRVQAVAKLSELELL
jgi:two-component system nitrate/nitrite response regulator NarL